jgi:hypothetical protein
MVRHLKIFILSAVFCLVRNTLFAQQAITVRGVVFMKSSTQRVSQVLITDLNNKNVMMSDDLGMFSISTAVGDTLLMTKKDYTPLKVPVVDKNDLSLFLQPVVQLNQVTVKGQTEKQELNDVMKQYRSEGLFNDGKSLPFWEALNSPVTELYNLFAKAPADARRFAAFSKNELESSEVYKRYTKELVKSVTKLSDDEVLKFMQFYTPSYQDIKEWNDYQLIAAIKKNFTYYKRTKNRQPQLQELPKIPPADQGIN